MLIHKCQQFPVFLLQVKLLQDCMAPTGLGGNSLSDLLVFGKRAGEFAAKFAKENGQAMSLMNRKSATFARKVLEPFERTEGDNPFQVQYDLQEMMQDLVGIVRKEEELLKAIEELKKLMATCR